MRATRLPAARWRRALLLRGASILVGLSLVALLELVLRLANLGQFAVTVDPYVGFAGSSPLFERSADGRLYQTAESRLGYFARDTFAAHKDPREFRIFCLGGSTVLGHPYSVETAFSSWLELELRAAAPERPWQVVNCGGISYASYRLVPIVEECLQYQPDLLVLYTGHNEFLEARTYESIRHDLPILRRSYWLLSRSRLFNLFTAALARSPRPLPTTARPANLLAAEVDALLDYRGGLAEYHRDDELRGAVVEHYRLNLLRMIALARRAGVPVLLVNPVSNLKDCPPFKIELNRELAEADRQRFERLWESAVNTPPTNVDSRLELLRSAIAIDDRHAGAHFLLGHSLWLARDYAAAAAAFRRAKDEDVCPLRMLEPLHAALWDAARVTHTPVVDARSLFEALASHGVVGEEQMIDHVHPTITGHQRIASALAEELFRQGWAKRTATGAAARDELFARHLASLEPSYYVRGQERLAGQHRWTQGRVQKLRLGAATAAKESPSGKNDGSPAKAGLPREDRK